MLRLARHAGLSDAIDRELVALRAAGDAGLPVPRVYERLELHGRPGLVLDRVASEDLLVAVLARPWRLPAAGRTLGALHARIHEVGAPGDVPDLREALTARLRAPLVPGPVRESAKRLLERLPDGDRLLHGDFHPGNVLRAPGGYAVIDWTGAVRGDPAADVARTWLLVREASVDNPGSAVVRRLLPLGRRVLWAGYLRAYRRKRAVSAAAVRAWLPVMAAARLAEDIPEERDRLLTLAPRP